MIWLLLPLAAIAFSFLIAVILDFRANKKFSWSDLNDQVTKSATYLASIGMAEILQISQPQYSHIVHYGAMAFAAIEILQTVDRIRTSLGKNDPLVETIDQIQANPTGTNGNPFDVLKK